MIVINSSQEAFHIPDFSFSYYICTPYHLWRFFSFAVRSIYLWYTWHFLCCCAYWNINGRGNIETLKCLSHHQTDKIYSFLIRIKVCIISEYMIMSIIIKRRENCDKRKSYMRKKEEDEWIRIIKFIFVSYWSKKCHHFSFFLKTNRRFSCRT